MRHDTIMRRILNIRTTHVRNNASAIAIQLNGLIKQMNVGNLKNVLSRASAIHSNNLRKLMARVDEISQKRIDASCVVAQSVRHIRTLLNKIQAHTNRIPNRDAKQKFSISIDEMQKHLRSVNGILKQINTEKLICQLREKENAINNIHGQIYKQNIEYIRFIQNIVRDAAVDNDNKKSPTSVFNLKNWPVVVSNKAPNNNGNTKTPPSDRASMASQQRINRKSTQGVSRRTNASWRNPGR